MSALRQAGPFLRRHQLFAAALLAATAVRVIAMLGYPGPLLFPDSSTYLTNALRLSPPQLRPAGYAVFLLVLSPARSVTLVIAVQHLLGLATAVLGYALLRQRFRLPGWAATLAMVPVLLSAYAIQMEHFILSDTLFGFLVTAALVAVMWRPVPPIWAYALAGALLAAAAIVRTQGAPILIVFAVCLLIRWAGRRTLLGVAVMCAVFAVPAATYAGWFDENHGSFGLTSSDGAFLYSEAVTFANCAVIHPPANLRRLCPTTPPSRRVPDSNYYMWRHRSLLARLPGGEFGNQANTLGREFTLDTIAAQPLTYLRVVLGNVAQSFLLHYGHPAKYSNAYQASTRQQEYMFPNGRLPFPFSQSRRALIAYTGTAHKPRGIQPWAGWIRTYQRYVVLPGPLLGLIAALGLAGAALRWRRAGGAALLPWLTGMALLIIPALAMFDTRYVLCAVLPLCLSGAIGVADITSRIRAGDAAGDGPTAGAQPEQVPAPAEAAVT